MAYPSYVEIPQRKGKMHTDLILFIAFIGIFLVGFAAGRWERKDSYVRGYRRGKMVGSALVMRNDR